MQVYPFKCCWKKQLFYIDYNESSELGLKVEVNRAKAFLLLLDYQVPTTPNLNRKKIIHATN